LQIYTVAHTLVEIPPLLLTSLALVSVAAPLAGLAVGSAGTFFSFGLTQFLAALAVTYFGFLLSVLLPQPKYAAVVISFLITAWVATCGFFLPFAFTKHFFLAVYWTNPIQYALNGLTAAAYYCNTAAPECTLPGCPGAAPICASCPCKWYLNPVKGPEYLWDFLVATRSARSAVYWDWLFLLCFCLVCRIGSFAALRFLRHNR
ncbi:hypothetical protein CLOP_g12653, partial [Closterium sp. NIES-67]